MFDPLDEKTVKPSAPVKAQNLFEQATEILDRSNAFNLNLKTLLVSELPSSSLSLEFGGATYKLKKITNNSISLAVFRGPKQAESYLLSSDGEVKLTSHNNSLPNSKVVIEGDVQSILTILFATQLAPVPKFDSVKK